MAIIYNEASFRLFGRLTATPELKTISTGTFIVDGAIAVNRPYRPEATVKADFFPYKAFGKTAEFMAKFLQKGAFVALQGVLQNETYTNKDGFKVVKTVCIVNKVDFVESKKKENESNDGGYQYDAPIAANFEEISGSDDLPF